MSATLIVRSFEELEPYRDRWDALAQGTGRAMPFMLFDWLKTCAESSPRGIEPYVILSRSSGQVHAIGPFGRLGKVIGRRRVVFLGMGPSDYQTVLGSPDHPEALAAVWDGLLTQADWDWIELDPVSEADAMRLRAADDARDSLSLSYQPKGICPFLELNADFERQVSRHTVKNAQYEWRRLQRSGRLDVRRATARVALHELLEGLFGLHERRWQAVNRVSRFANAAERSLFELLTHVWLEHHMLDASGLYWNDRLIAAHVGACTPERFYYHTPAFDPGFGKHSPSKVLLWWLLQDCRARGIARFDFLRGDEEYKRVWGALPGEPYGRLRMTRKHAVLSRLPDVFDRVGKFVSRSPRAKRAARVLKAFIGE